MQLNTILFLSAYQTLLKIKCPFLKKQRNLGGMIIMTKIGENWVCVLVVILRSVKCKGKDWIRGWGAVNTFFSKEA